MTAVAVTAVGALKNDSENRNRDYLLFFLFFVFPVIGPVLQYLFPVLPLMGVSQAIALLTVYLAVQQRTAAQYAVQGPL